jgi:hypothetical protein
MGYNFDYSYGKSDQDSDFRPRSLSDLAGSGGGYVQRSGQQDYRPLSSLVNQPGETRFVDPEYTRQLGQGMIYKATPESNTEYYSGPDKDSFYRDYMTRQGFGRAINELYNQ